jgi:hypothetical protein
MLDVPSHPRREEVRDPSKEAPHSFEDACRRMGVEMAIYDEVSAIRPIGPLQEIARRSLKGLDAGILFTICKTIEHCAKYLAGSLYVVDNLPVDSQERQKQRRKVIGEYPWKKAFIENNRIRPRMITGVYTWLDMLSLNDARMQQVDPSTLSSDGRSMLRKIMQLADELPPFDIVEKYAEMDITKKQEIVSKLSIIAGKFLDIIECKDGDVDAV